MKRLELYDGTSVVINVAQVTWLKVRDARTTRVHFAGTNTIHVKGSVTEVEEVDEVRAVLRRL